MLKLFAQCSRMRLHASNMPIAAIKCFSASAPIWHPAAVRHFRVSNVRECAFETNAQNVHISAGSCMLTSRAAAQTKSALRPARLKCAAAHFKDRARILMLPKPKAWIVVQRRFSCNVTSCQYAYTQTCYVDTCHWSRYTEQSSYMGQGA